MLDKSATSRRSRPCVASSKARRLATELRRFRPATWAILDGKCGPRTFEAGSSSARIDSISASRWHRQTMHFWPDGLTPSTRPLARIQPPLIVEFERTRLQHPALQLEWAADGELGILPRDGASETPPQSGAVRARGLRSSSTRKALDRAGSACRQFRINAGSLGPLNTFTARRAEEDASRARDIARIGTALSPSRVLRLAGAWLRCKTTPPGRLA